MNLLTFGLYGALSAGTFFLSLNLVQAQNYSMTIAGLAFTPFALILTALSRWAGGLVDRGGPRLPLIIGPAVAGAAFFVVAFCGLSDGPARYWVTFFPGIVLLGHRHGDHRRAADHRRHELRGHALRGHGVRDQQRGLPHRGGACHCSGGSTGPVPVLQRAAGAYLCHRSQRGGAGRAVPRRPRAWAAASVPPQVAPEKTAEVQTAIRLAFVDAFQVVMLICVRAVLDRLRPCAFVERKFTAAA